MSIGRWRRAQRGKPWSAEIAHSGRQIGGALRSQMWARPMFYGGTLTSRSAMRRRMLALESCEVWDREFGGLALNRSPSADLRFAHSAPGAATRVHKLVKQIYAAEERATSTPSERETDDDLATEAFNASADHPTRLLLRIEAALRHLQRS